MNKGNVFRLSIFFILILSFFLSIIFVKPVKKYVLIALDWVEKFGWWGNLLIIVIYLFTSSIGLAGSFAILSIGCGFAYGILKGLGTAYLGSLLGAILSFILGRTLLR